MNTLAQAVTLLESGDWKGAHEIVQTDESPQGSWAHGIVHMMEGDMDNAGYWYRKAGRPLPDTNTNTGTVRAEIAALKRALDQVSRA